MIERLVIASHNDDKIGEIESVLLALGLVGEIVRGLAWGEIEETGETLEDNALAKARIVMEVTGLPALADDTGLEVDALSGAPGVHTARFAGPTATYADNVAKMLDVLASEENRHASFRTVMALVAPDGFELTAEGSLVGRITREPRGSAGFGYDPIFEVDGATLAEMEPHAKNEISHRARALRELARGLA